MQEIEITPQLKEELSHWLESFWNTYLRGDFETWSTLIEDDYYNVGGTELEIWQDKQEILEYSYGSRHQIVGKIDFRNRDLQVRSAKEYLVLNESSEFYRKKKVQWTFSGHFRMSSFLKRGVNGWTIAHQYGTYPNMGRTQKKLFEDDALKAENIRLQSIVEEGTEKLLRKNRVLEMETALERVRSAAMAMQKTSELENVIKVVDQQFKELNIDNSGGAFIYLNREIDKKAGVTWGASGVGNYVRKVHIPYFDQPIYVRSVEAVRKREKFLIEYYDADEKRAFFRHLFNHPPFNETPIEHQDYLLSMDSGYARSTVINDHTSIMIINYDGVAFTDEENEFLKQMGLVFEQAFIRFLDLEKSETQSKYIRKERDRLEVTLQELHSTQSQLIHSEKMASLGELTAGIAHEIQNPLNFVNNFSELNRELIEELKDAVTQNDQDEVQAILLDLSENEDKITHHGKRAEEIVKNMLQHSRKSSGEKEITDLNSLCDEYLRLAFHGLRAKDKSFNASFSTDFTSDLPKLKVVPQDIGRVLLNLINNAFQAVNGQSDAQVKVATKTINDKVQITVTDNGPGIPEDIRDKIFQPFFTTKPTGEGTGLGLSMSYDIVTKGHGGNIELKSQPGVGTEFTVIIPST